MENAILAAVASLYGMTAETLKGKLQNPETFEALSNEEIKETIFSLHKQKLESVKKHTAGEAVKNALAARQRKLAEKYSLDPSGTIEQMFETFASKSNQNSSSPAEITSQQVLNHPDFLKLKGKFDAYKGQLEEAKQSLEAERKGRKKDKVMTTVRGKIKELWLSKNPLLSQDPQNKSRQIEAFLSQFERENFDIKEDGSVILTNEDGSEKVDENYNSISLEHLVMSRNYYDLGGKETNKKPSPKYPNGSEVVKHNFSDSDLNENYMTKRRELQKAGDKEGLAQLDQAFEIKHFGSAEKK